MRIGIISLQHESNTFIATPTTLDDFRRETLAAGPGAAAQFEGAHHEIGGFIEALRQAGAQAVPIFAAWAMPAGKITGDTHDQLLAMMFDALADAGPLDGLLVAPHGAAVSEREPDMDGHWLALLRSKVGPGMPMVCTLDPHTNLTPRMIEACDATVTYRTNPHLDQRQRGVEAAGLIVRMLRGEARPTQAAAFPCVAINIEKQETAKQPCAVLYELADEMRSRAGVLAVSVALGFPYSDVPEMGTAFIVVTDNDAGLARQCADELADHLWRRRDAFVAELIGIEDAVADAATGSGPVCLLDMGDNVGGGSPADGTIIAQYIHQRGGPKTFVAICDPEAVEQAGAAGIGQKLPLRVGGKSDDRHGPPLDTQFVVRSLHDGQFSESKPRHGGRATFDMGATAIVETGAGLTVQVTTRRITPFSLNQLICCGLEPSSFQIMIAKGVVAPVAAYAEVCPRIIRVNTPGVTTADMESLDYHHRRRPLFPFEKPERWR